MKLAHDVLKLIVSTAAFVLWSAAQAIVWLAALIVAWIVIHQVLHGELVLGIAHFSWS